MAKFNKPLTKSTPKKGETDIAELLEMMNKVSGPKNFKLRQDGPVRIRIINPRDSKTPIQPAFEHWIPVIDEKGEERKKAIICPKSKGRMEPCPVCTLLSFFGNSAVPEIKNLSREIHQNARYLVYLIDRSYMIGMINARQPVVVIPDQEKVYDARLPKAVMDKILEQLRDPIWGDCFKAEGGYDWKITGGKKGGQTFATYDVTPVPKEHSPNYDPMLAAGLKPLEVIAPITPLDDIVELVQAQLQFAMEVGGEEGAEIVEAFMKAWEEESGNAESIEVESPPEEEEAEDNVEEEGSDESGSDESSEGEDEDEESPEGEADEGVVEESGDDGPVEEDGLEEEEAPESPKKVVAPNAKPAPEAKESSNKGGVMPQGFAAKLTSLREKTKK